ncbi:unnamed protein product [Albugo candida]|uniref:MULE transposase domain-containing protein n=1 Tax=Albugo candida TaxID=65357 RepID=A0A024FXX4_9STRA|nr:unnamed protein product [Albugo candida]|eukprot:CCI11484.1 unnamed protein product [Albugo candida]
MNALDDVFPETNNLLCRWHISKNILARKRRTFEAMEAFNEFTGRWNALVMSATAQIYQRRLTEMREAFPRQVLTYIEETWLAHKENFVSAYLLGKLYFGHTATSRVESAHSALKKWIAVSIGELLMVDSACQLACEGNLQPSECKPHESVQSPICSLNKSLLGQWGRFRWTR